MLYMSLRLTDSTQTSVSIESISDILRELKDHFNACAPIGRLPEAVLTIVFKFAAFNDAVDTLKACERRTDVDFKILVALTHVCSGWRSVALEYPALWTRFNAPPLPQPTYL